MSREKQNDELVQMYRDLGEIFDEEYEKRRLITPQNTAEKLTAKGYRKQSEVDLREEVTSDDFHDLELAKERGWHRKKFYCPNCDLLIKTETWDSKRMFGNSTVLKTNELPNFCPNCGAKIKGGE